MTVEPSHVTWEKRLLKAVSSGRWAVAVDVALVLAFLVLVYLYAKPF